MRLKEAEITSIKRCAEKHFGPNCAVRLFGSRVNDARRGGDIDLHVQVDDDALSTMACKIRYLSELEAVLRSIWSWKAPLARTVISTG